jgi:predicted Zn-dependent protease
MVPGDPTPTRRGRIRIGWILAVSLLVLIGGFVGYHRHTHQRRQNTLKLLAQAQAADAEHDWEKASTFYHLYLKRKPSDAAALSAYATVLLKRMEGSPELIGDTAGTLRQLIRLEPDNVAAIEQLVGLYLRFREFALAEQHAQNWIRQVPDSVDAVIALAHARHGLLKHTLAAEGLVQAIEQMPDKPRLYAPLIELLTVNLDRPHEAAEWTARGCASTHSRTKYTWRPSRSMSVSGTPRQPRPI